VCVCVYVCVCVCVCDHYIIYGDAVSGMCVMPDIMMCVCVCICVCMCVCVIISYISYIIMSYISLDHGACLYTASQMAALECSLVYLTCT